MKSNSTQRLVGLRKSENRNPHDHYITPKKAIEELLKREFFEGIGWEPASGSGAISKIFEKRGYIIYSSDIRIDDNVYGIKGLDFLISSYKVDWIVTNPPFKDILAFIKKALESADKIAIFGRIQLLEGKERYKFFMKNPPKRVYVFSNRISCIDPKTGWKTSEILCFCWFIWEKGFKGKPTIEWILAE